MFVMKIIIFITQKIKNWADKRWPFTPTPLCPLHVLLSIMTSVCVCVCVTASCPLPSRTWFFWSCLFWHQLSPDLVFLSPTPGHCSPSEQSVRNSVDTPGQSPDRLVSSVYNRANLTLNRANITLNRAIQTEHEGNFQIGLSHQSTTGQSSYLTGKYRLNLRTIFRQACLISLQQAKISHQTGQYRRANSFYIGNIKGNTDLQSTRKAKILYPISQKPSATYKEKFYFLKIHFPPQLLP